MVTMTTKGGIDKNTLYALNVYRIKLSVCIKGNIEHNVVTYSNLGGLITTTSVTSLTICIHINVL